MLRKFRLKAMANPGFPRRERAPTLRGCQSIILAISSLKLHEIEKHRKERGAGPMDPPMKSIQKKLDQNF